MKVLLLDVYRSSHARISKDTNGGYGTVNDYGDGFVADKLTRLKARSVDWPPLSGVHAAGVIRSRGHSVTYRKAVLDQVATLPLDGYDLCLMTTSIVCHETEVEAVRKLRARNINVGVVGPFASAVPQPYLDAGAFVISGEPEIYLHRVDSLDHLPTASGTLLPPPPKGEVVTIDGELRIDAELDQLPMPAWDLICETSIPHYGLTGNKKPFLPLIATRGCPYSCSHYCVYPWQQGKQVRLRTPRKIVEEMAHWQDTFGVSLFMFRDPVFSLNRKHTVRLCEEIIESGRKFQFIIETHLNNMDDELSPLLKRAGLIMLKTGIESSDFATLKTVKRFTVKEQEQADRIRFLKDLDIKVTCFYMFGFPQDTAESCRRTIKYAQKLNTFGAQFSVFTPYPGTPAFKEYESKLTTRTLEDFTQWQLVFQHEHISSDQMRSLLGQAYRQYYTNPRWISEFVGSRLRALVAS